MLNTHNYDGDIKRGDVISFGLLGNSNRNAALNTLHVNSGSEIIQRGRF